MTATSSDDNRTDVPPTTRPPSSVVWAARLWRASAAVGFLTTLWELLIARFYLDVLSNGEVGAAAVIVLVVVAVVVAVVAVGYWAIELRAAGRLAAGRARARTTLTVVGAISAVLVLADLATSFVVGVVVTTLVLLVLHLAVVVAALVTTHAPATTAWLGERADGTPAASSRAATAVLALLGVVVVAAAGFAGSTRHTVMKLIAAAATEQGAQSVHVDCDYTLGLAYVAGDVDGHTCDVAVDGRAQQLVLSTTAPGRFDATPVADA